MSIRSRLGKGFQSQVFSQIVRIVIQVANVPLLLIFWGTDVFGEWLVLTALSQYLSISSIGFVNATAREMVMAESRGDRDDTLSLFQSTWGLLTLLSTVIFLAVAVVVYVFPVNTLANVSVLSLGQVRLILLTQCALVLLSIQANLLHCGYVCKGRYGEVYFYLAMMALLNNLALFASAWMGASPDHASVVMLVTYAACLCIMRLLLRRTAPWLTCGIQHMRIATVKRLVKPSYASMATILSNALNIQALRVVIGIIVGPASVVIFTTLRTLTRLTKMVINSFEQIITPELGIAFGSGDMKLMTSIFIKLTQVMIWVSLIFCAFLWVGGEWILNIWTAGKVEMEYSLYFPLILSVLVDALWFPSYVVLAAVNKHFNIANVFLATNAVMIAIAVVLMYLIGVQGAGIAVLFLEVVMCIFAIPKAMAFLDLKGFGYFCRAVQPPLFLWKEFRLILGRK